jgi:hypothetical protein
VVPVAVAVAAKAEDQRVLWVKVRPVAPVLPEAPLMAIGSVVVVVVPVRQLPQLTGQQSSPVSVVRVPRFLGFQLPFDQASVSESSRLAHLSSPVVVVVEPRSMEPVVPEVLAVVVPVQHMKATL